MDFAVLETIVRESYQLNSGSAIPSGSQPGGRGCRGRLAGIETNIGANIGTG